MQVERNIYLSGYFFSKQKKKTLHKIPQLNDLSLNIDAI